MIMTRDKEYALWGCKEDFIFNQFTKEFDVAPFGNPAVLISKTSLSNGHCGIGHAVMVDGITPELVNTWDLQEIFQGGLK